MPFTLRDAQISAEFSSRGELLSLKNEETGTELIRPGFPWKLILTRGSSLEEELPPDGNRPEIRQAGNRLEMNFDALRGGDVAHVVSATNLSDQIQIPLHLLPLALGVVAGKAVPLCPVSVVDAPAICQQGLILAMGGDGLVQRFGKLHGIAHLLL